MWCAQAPTAGRRVLTYVERCPGTEAEEMAAALRLSKRRVVEILGTLASVGMVRQSTIRDSRRYAYFPGPALQRLRGVAAP